MLRGTNGYGNAVLWAGVSACFWVADSAWAVDGRTFSYGKHAQQNLTVYAPAEKADQGSPVVVWVHGGGWRNGDKDNRTGVYLLQTWAEAGVVAVGLDYRLTPEVTHPAHIDDVAAGVAWVRKHIAEHGGDPQRVFLLGHSAGAHLVALAATAPAYLKAHDLTPAEALAGVISVDTASYDLAATRSRLVRNMISEAFGDQPETLAAASPLVQARKNPQLVPPLVIAVVKQRPEAVDESKALHAALPGSKLIVADYPGNGQLAAHGLIARDLANLRSDLAKQILEFVRAKPKR